jgi:hypothetical protein
MRTLLPERPARGNWNLGTGDSRLINRSVVDLTGGSVEYIRKRPGESLIFTSADIAKIKRDLDC